MMQRLIMIMLIIIMLIIIRRIMIMLMSTYVQQVGEVDLAAGIETTADGSCAVL